MTKQETPEALRQIVRNVLNADDPSAMRNLAGVRGEIARMVADEIYAATGNLDFMPERVQAAARQTKLG